MSTPEEIRRDIERTRAELSDNVSALGDSASPSNIARGQVDKVKDSATSFKERVFGSPNDPYDDGIVGDARARLGDSGDDASGLVSGARDAVNDAPQQVKSHTRGNPMAAGLIAMGIGALIGGLIPASRRESEAANQLKEAAQPLVDQAKQVAAETKDNLQPLVQEAVGAVKDVAQDGGEKVKQDASQAKDSVSDKARTSADTVRDDAQQAAEKSKQDARQAAENQKDGDNHNGPGTFHG
ncbi:MAG: DUF3618 domain-containing protein [Arachnia sp.]